ncbi:hypothetical protein Rhal01_02315 [Rubritalea halochordaticola]|uniref:Uncharacterized protein n=1 Tax=Rubritalea halochordaticola TaxID=714537 RepID=A0ABP9V0B8_9BACT
MEAGWEPAASAAATHGANVGTTQCLRKNLNDYLIT